jgi:hypothetical protein
VIYLEIGGRRVSVDARPDAYLVSFTNEKPNFWQKVLEASSTVQQKVEEPQEHNLSNVARQVG